MNFSYNWLQSFFGRKLPKPEKLAELLTLHAFEVEGVKKNGEDFILDIAVFPNRGSDCFSHIGIAREIAAILDLRFKIGDLRIREDKKIRAKDFVKVSVENKGGCPRYTARVITGVEVGPSPKWIRERLTVCGLRPINNIVDITNYVMLETGQPLHAFDREKLEGKKIVVRFAERKEKITTLDGEKYDLDEDILVIADAKKPIAIAGIKGGKLPEIDQKTKTVVLESANFNPQNIRKASKLIDLKTDASLRFEHGLDPNLAEFAINRAAFLVQEVAKGTVVQGLIDVYSKKVLAKIVLLKLDSVEKLLGVKISEKEIKDILMNLEFKIKSSNKKVLQIEVPTFRLDISGPEDVIEEIGRIYGYEKIPAVFPRASLIPSKRNLDIFWENMAKNILKEAGFAEAYNYSFISESDGEILKYNKKELVELKNPISSDFQFLRPSLILNILKDVEKNQKNLKEIKIFELGKIFWKEQRAKNKEEIVEKRMLTGIITGEKFYEAKGAVDSLLQEMGISNIWCDEYNPTPEESKMSIWRVLRCAEIKIDNEEIGFLGEISGKILSELKIPKVIVFDIDFEKLSKLASEEHEYRPLSRFPSAVRDLAVLVPRLVKVEEVLNKMEEAGKGLIRDVDLFDIYEGEQLPEGKKNLAFHIIYQAEDRTLTSKEIDEVQNKIVKILESMSEWQVRK